MRQYKSQRSVVQLNLQTDKCVLFYVVKKTQENTLSEYSLVLLIPPLHRSPYCFGYLIEDNQGSYKNWLVFDSQDDYLQRCINKVTRKYHIVTLG